MADETMIIVAGGSSVAEYDVRDLTSRGYVVGVNESALLCKVDAAITMDRLWFEHRWPQLKERSVPVWVRLSACKNVKTEPNELWIFSNDHTSTVMTDESATLNGTNSAMCALNLAYVARPKRLYLFGFDCMQGPGGKHYWYPPYPWATPKPGKLRDWSRQYGGIAQQLKERGVSVFNVSHRTALTCFPIISFKQFLKDTTHG